MDTTDKRKQQKKDWAKNNRDKENARYYRWRKNNPERYLEFQRNWREKNREHKNEYDRKWCSENPDRIRLKSINRRCSLKKAGYLLISDIRYIYKRDKKCLCCGIQTRLTIDHIIPISKNGKNARNNLQILCLSCNDKKGVKVIDYRQ